MKKRSSSLEKNKLLFYVVVAISFFNILLFLNEKNWNSVIFFVLAAFIAYTFKVDKTFSIVIALVSANIFWASTKLREGIDGGVSQDKEKQKITVENKPIVSTPPVATPASPPVATPALPTVATPSVPVATNVKPSDSHSTMGGAKSAENATQVDGKEPMQGKFADIDSKTLEGLTSTAHSLMDRQDQLHSLAKQLGPLMKQASKMMKQLPDGFLQDALKKKR